MPHADQHANANDAIIAVETYVLGQATLYPLLAGRAGGQTLDGDTASGGDLTLKGTAHATPGSVFIQSGSIFEVDGGSGQLKLPTTGSGAGILVGGDVHLYRVAADVWSSPDSIRVGGYLQVGI